MRALGNDEIAVSESEIPQNPQPERAPEPSTAEPSAGAPASAPPEQVAAETLAPGAEPQSSNGGTPVVSPESPKADRLASVKQLVSGRRGMWAGVAALCVAAGVAGSVLGAHALAQTDRDKTRQAFHLSVTSTGIASAVRQATQREEDLLVGASTFFAANSKATPSEFSAWVRSTGALHQYPELAKLGFVALRVPEAAPATTLLSARGLRPLTSSSTPSERAAFRPVAPVKRPDYCAAVAELARTATNGSTVRVGHCSLTSGMLASRDSGLSSVTATSAGAVKALGIVTPVYRGDVTPATRSGRRANFVGWLHEVLLPGVVLQAALSDHPGAAARLRYRAGSANIVFSSGTPQTGAQSLATSLHGGWTLRSFGPAVAAGVFADGHAVAVLIAGCVLSVLAGLLVFFLGSGPARVLAPASPSAPVRKVPHEDLYDPLTGLPNRALMLDRAQRMLARAGRQSGLLIGALFIDIDWFKDVSEKIGPPAGDQLLGIVAERLEGVVRAQDSVGRLGGDEFVVLVESAARGARLESLARRVIEALHKPVVLDNFGPSFFVTASIGVAFGRYDTADDLLRDARLAMHAAKVAGKDRYTLFNANMRSVTESRAVLEAELNTALQDKQLFLLYEPVYDLNTRKVASLSTHVRWQHPKRGALDPEDFLPLAEETGLIVPLGRWVLEEACNRAAAWNVAGNRVGISVNVSANQLNRDGFAIDVRRALQQSGIEPSLLTLEIAETTVMRDVEAAAARLREVKQLGVRIAIDDFGSGYAYHADLQRLPLDFLTVDRSSLAATDDENYRSWLLEAILVVGRDLSLTVIARGIETPEQLTALQQMGCTMAQGSLFGKPTAPDAVESLFHAEFPAGKQASTALVGASIPAGLSPAAPAERPAGPLQ
jgi:diguanylate cyclase (GGDEF)-like protein